MKKIALTTVLDENEKLNYSFISTAYLAGAVKDLVNVDIVPSTETTDVDKFLSSLSHNNYNYIGLSIYTKALSSAKKLIGLIKSRFSNSLIIVGGPHVTGEPTCLDSELRGADFGIRSEGERALRELLIALNDLDRSGELCENSLHQIDNLIYRDRQGKLIINKVSLAQDIDSLIPAWDKCPVDYFQTPTGIGMHAKGTRVA